VKRKTNDKGQTASDFIRSCHKNMSAKEIVEAGAKEGLTFKPVLVYTVRLRANGKTTPKRKAKKNGKRRVRRSKTTVASTKIPVSLSAIVERFKADLEACFRERARDALSESGLL
jgi:hypothetical protein